MYINEKDNLLVGCISCNAINEICFTEFYFLHTKLLTTQSEVSKLQEDLETMQPLLAQAAKETEETMEKIKVDSVCTYYLIF